MARGYLPVDRDQQFLLPPNVRDWLPEGHLVWFVLDVVARVDTSGLHAGHRLGGAGRRAYDPEMLLALLIYSYCMGQRSSRQIERLCEVDVAYRVICANWVPDHTTIARFRQGHQTDAVRLFTDVLILCAECGLVKVGVIAVDGTKVAGVASLKANRTREQIEKEVAKMIVEADEVDSSEDDLFGGDRGDELPVDLVDPRSRRARLDAALVEMTRREAERVAAEQAASQGRAAAEAKAAGELRTVAGRRPKGREVELAERALEFQIRKNTLRRERLERDAAARGRKPCGPAFRGGDLWRARARLAKARAVEQQQSTPDTATKNPSTSSDERALRVNLSDPDSRTMTTPHGWIQGFNAQAAANENGIVIAADVTQQVNDSLQCEPMMRAIDDRLTAAGVTDTVGMLLFDAGYISEANIAAAGPPRLIATGKSWKLRKQPPTSGPPPPDASPIESMQHRLCTPEGSALYKKRQHTIEPIFATIKEPLRFRRFSRRGLDAVKAEWQLITTAQNINKLYNHRAT